ncbi:hypothetical protein LINPERHAP1_LOCUS26922 [Linum perenne]
MALTSATAAAILCFWLFFSAIRSFTFCHGTFKQLFSTSKPDCKTLLTGSSTGPVKIAANGMNSSANGPVTSLQITPLHLQQS